MKNALTTTNQPKTARDGKELNTRWEDVTCGR